MTENYLKKYGGELIDRGYWIVPIAKGEKHPKGIKGWQNERATHGTLQKWIRMGYPGVGIQSKYTIGVDLDIYDPVIALRMKKIVIDILGPSLERVGLAPKVLLPYRTLGPFRKVQSKRFISPDGHIHKVEILGEGQQWVGYHIHPDTGSPYVWTYEGNLCEGIRMVDFDTLPLIDAVQAQNITEAFLAILPSSWQEYNGEDDHPYLLNQRDDSWLDEAAPISEEQWEYAKEYKSPSNGASSGPRDGDAFSYLKPKLNLSRDEVAAALKCVSAGDYEVMLRVGMAMWHQYDGDADGFELWNDWCMTSSKYTDRGEKEYKWSTFNPEDDARDPVTFASVLRMARQARMDTNPLAEFLRTYVYVEDGDCVVDLDRAPNAKPMEMKSFRNMTANIRMQIKVPAPTVKDEARMKDKMVPVHSVWLTHPARKSAVGLCYHPGKGRLVPTGFRDDVEVNQFYMAEHVEGVGADLGVFGRHMKYLFPIESNREWFLDWMAFGLQKPGVRSKVTPLHIAVDHGTGRGWIVELIYKLVGHWNCAKTRMSTMTADGGYNEYIDQTLFCFIEEVHEGDKRFGISDKVRDVLTDNYAEVNLKYGRKGTVEIFTNFSLMSNHTDALVLKAEDRRIAVFLCDAGFKPKEYTDALYAWSLDVRNVGRLFHWLMSRELKDFDYTRAPWTQAKDDMIGFNRTGVERELMDFLEDHPEVEAAPLSAIVEYINASEDRGFGREVSGKEEKQLLKVLQQVGKKLGRMRFGGNPIYVWQLHRREIVTDTKARESGTLLEKIMRERKERSGCVGGVSDNWMDGE